MFFCLRYCAKLPSDTFTKLSPIWNILSVIYENQAMFVCSIRLPINSPIKHDIHVSINFLLLITNLAENQKLFFKSNEPH